MYSWMIMVGADLDVKCQQRADRQKGTSFEIFYGGWWRLCLVIATAAYEMAIDGPDVRRVVLWRLPTTWEEYIQESGKAWQNGVLSVAVFYDGKGVRHVNLC